jgi:ribosomal protein S21
MNKKHKIWQSHIPGAALGAETVNTKMYDKNGNSYMKPDLEFALRFWKRAMKDSGKLIEFKNRTRYTKKSEKRRVQLQNAKFIQWVEDQNNQ